MADYEEGQIATNPETGKSLQFTDGKWQPVKPLSPSISHSAQNTLNALFKGAGGGIDAVLNTPQNIANLGIAGYGALKGALGGTDLPQPMENPDYARRAMEATGLIRNDIAPQNVAERILDTGAQAAGGALTMPGGSLASIPRNVALSGLSGTIGQGTTEATGSELAGALASMVAPAVAPSLGASSRRKIAGLQEEQAQNVARDKITSAGMSEGYVLPSSENNPSAVNKTIESIGGKAATKQEAEIRNQGITNKLVREELGLPRTTPLTEETLADLRDNFAAPYRAVAAIPAFKTTNKIQTGVDPLTNQPITKSVTEIIDPAKILEDLKVARADSNAWWKAYSRDAHPETKDKAVNFQDKANKLETQLEQIATNSGQPDLVNQLRQARREIAKTYTVEQALNVGSTNISARALGKARDKGAPLTGNLKLIGEFAQQNPQFTREASGVSTPGVSNVDAMAGGATAILGHPVAGGVVLARGPARALALSKWYQQWQAKPNYSPSSMAKALQGFTPEERKFALARMAEMQSQSQEAQ